ncbi:heme NO-binding domain-containing protein [Persicobacter diffluens]|uniref:Guanylate cyclase n=1 Tax=Persicobacter diffluens TaxID=981 RepID=A0AAN4W213_9BACT|nr:guanylate cyclase [Persicobacter diffluens]
MKGVVFTEFIDMVEDKFGFTTVDNIIENSNLPSGGAYTAVGTYDYHEMLSLVANLHKETQIGVEDLMKVFGEHLFSRLASLYPHFMEGVTDPFEFLATIENYIHVEVKKLYPDAELPSFETELMDDRTLKMVYQSIRCLSPVAEGLIMGCMKYFDSACSISTKMLTEKGDKVEFLISRK